MVVERRLAAAELEKLGVAVAEETPAPAAAPGPTGERYVTVLFMDVRGYTSLARVASPAEVADSVATLQRWAATEVEKHHGIVDKFAGDAVMATFNSSGAHVDHAQHALACAMAIRDKAGMLGLPMGAGIATGPAVVGALKDGANVSVIGEATNLASRLQAQAGSGEIVLSMESHRRVADWLSSRGHAAESEPARPEGVSTAGGSMAAKGRRRRQRRRHSGRDRVELPANVVLERFGKDWSHRRTRGGRASVPRLNGALRVPTASRRPAAPVDLLRLRP